MSNLVEFLSKLGSDPALAEAFSKDPETTMTKAGLTAEEMVMVRNGDVESLKSVTGTSVRMVNGFIIAYKQND